MIDVFYYSICGKKSNQVIDDLVQTFIDSEYVPEADKKILRHVQEVGKCGNYPSEEYFSTFYQKAAFTYKSLAEITNYCKAVSDFYQKQSIEKRLIAAINDSNSTKDLLDRLSSISDVNQVQAEDILDDLKPVTYGDLKSAKFVKGIPTGIKELDDVTSTFQPGNVASICAFTGHGKSTCLDSILFKNALEGKKCCLLSIEVAPELVWAQIEARYMNQVKGIQVNAQDIMFRKMPSDIEDKVLAAEEDFKKEIATNIIILDESFISKQMMLNYKSFSALMRQVERKLDGLHLLGIDHVGQFELMYPDCGNQIIKSIQSFTKTYVNEEGTKPVTIMAVQTNRQGEMRARKRSGVYDLQAISDLNEVERTSSYIVFLYTSDDMKIMQETKVTLAKHRFGTVISEPVVTTFNPGIITVGAAIENVQMSDDDFNGMDLDLGNDFGSFDEF